MYTDAYLYWFCAKLFCTNSESPKPVHSSLYRTGTHLQSISMLWSYKPYEYIRLQISKIENLIRSDFPVKILGSCYIHPPQSLTKQGQNKTSALKKEQNLRTDIDDISSLPLGDKWLWRVMSWNWSHIPYDFWTSFSVCVDNRDVKQTKKKTEKENQTPWNYLTFCVFKKYMLFFLLQISCLVRIFFSYISFIW